MPCWMPLVPEYVLYVFWGIWGVCRWGKRHRQGGRDLVRRRNACQPGKRVEISVKTGESLNLPLVAGQSNQPIVEIELAR